MKRIHELSITDDCTGLFNARHLYTRVEEQLQLAADQPFSLLFMDLDHFKRINDVHGHLVGSRLLAEVGALVKRIASELNPSFRYGGDEFVILLPNHDKPAGTALAKKLFRAMRTARFLQNEGLDLELRGSFGLASYPEDGNSIDSIIKSADSMMYEVKGSTRDNLAVAGVGLLFAPGTIEGEMVERTNRLPEGSTQEDVRPPALPAEDEDAAA